MKNLILGIALAGLLFGCKNNDNTQVSDGSTAAVPEAGCGSGDGAGCDMSSGGCETMDSAGCESMAKKESAGCGGCASQEDSEAGTVCPSTGAIEN